MYGNAFSIAVLVIYEFPSGIAAKLYSTFIHWKWKYHRQQGIISNIALSQSQHLQAENF